MNKDEQSKRKQLLKELKEKEREIFEKSLPMKRELFEQLFDFLDEELGIKSCADTNILTSKFLIANNLDNEIVLNWLEDKGGYCDCEILANVEELFEK